MLCYNFFKTFKIEDNPENKLYLYIKKGDIASQKIQQWLDTHGLFYHTITIHTLNELHLLQMLKNSELGFEDIISQKKFCNHYEVENLTVKAMIKQIIQNPHVLKCPILFNNTNIMTGYNTEEIRKFIPRYHRNIARN